MSHEDSDSSENDNWDEFDEPGVPSKCLFCDISSDTIAACISHISNIHKLDIVAHLRKNVSSTYDLIKIVTYLRTHKPSTEDVVNVLGKREWDCEKYLKPVDPEDPWLWTDFEFIGDDEDTEPKYVNAENGVITLSKEHFDQLQKCNQELQRLLDEKEVQANKLRELLDSADQPAEGARGSNGRDMTYFSSYASFDIHREMLNDAPRMAAFGSIFHAKDLFQGKAVLDVGCGTGVLSMMAASAGAKSVVGVDESDIFYTAVEIVNENGFDNVIRLVKGKVETLEEEQKFDIIVSEWMGYFLLFEGMLSSVIIARDRFLKPGGMIFPRTCSIHMCGLSDKEGRDRRLQEVFSGYKMSAFRRTALKEASVEIVPQETIVTELVEIYNLDILTCQQSDCFFSSDFRLVSTQDTELTALCGWFKSTFEPSSEHVLDTSPLATPTHWKQTVFYLDRVVKLNQGVALDCKLTVRPVQEDSRALAIDLIVGSDIEQSFTVE